MGCPHPAAPIDPDDNSNEDGAGAALINLKNNEINNTASKHPLYDYWSPLQGYTGIQIGGKYG
jgi:hypothetical protein